MREGFDFEISPVKPGHFWSTMPNMAIIIVTNYSVFFTLTNSEHIKKISPAGNRTPVSRVTGGDTNHYTTEDRSFGGLLKQQVK